jgi:tetratricopeptide (TPR) repeat protein
VEHFQQVLAVLPQFADAHNNLARGLGAIGRKDEAIEEYQETLRLDPNHAPAHSNLAGALLNQGKVDEAIAHYQRALEIDPEYVDAHYNIAIAYKVRGEPDNSIEHYRIVLGLHPNAFFAYLARNDIALILMHKGEVEEALRLLREAASINETARVDLVKDAARRNLALFGKE